MDYIKVSDGGSKDLNSFYATTNSLSYGSYHGLREQEKEEEDRVTKQRAGSPVFLRQTAKSSATGYVTNVIMNHAVKNMPGVLATTFSTEVTKDSVMHGDGPRSSSPNLKQAAGFKTVVNPSPIHYAPNLDASGRTKSPPRARSSLDEVRRVQPLEAENDGTGPNIFSTTTGSSIKVPHMQNQDFDANRVNKVQSGWTDNMTVTSPQKKPTHPLEPWNSSYKSGIGMGVPIDINKGPGNGGDQDSSFAREGRWTGFGQDEGIYRTSNQTVYTIEAVQGIDASSSPKKPSGYAINSSESRLNINEEEFPSSTWEATSRSPLRVNPRCASADPGANGHAEDPLNVRSGFVRAGEDLSATSFQRSQQFPKDAVHPALQKLQNMRDHGFLGNRYKVGGK